jgi:hypothetical protein
MCGKKKLGWKTVRKMVARRHILYYVHSQFSKRDPGVDAGVMEKKDRAD